MLALIIAAAVHSAVARGAVIVTTMLTHLSFAGLFSCFDTKMDAGTPKQQPKEGEKGEEVTKALGLNTDHHAGSSHEAEEEGYDMVPNPDADVVDLSELRGTRAPGTAAERNGV